MKSATGLLLSRRHARFSTMEIPDVVRLLDSSLAGLADSEEERRKPLDEPALGSFEKKLVAEDAWWSTVALSTSWTYGISVYGFDVLLLLGFFSYIALRGLTWRFISHKSQPKPHNESRDLYHVKRNDKIVMLNEQQIVVGDIVQFTAGTVAPADFRIVDCENLRVNEGLFTGDSTSVVKSADKLTAVPNTPVMSNMILKGSLILEGTGSGIAVHVASATVLQVSGRYKQQSRRRFENKISTVSKGYHVFLGAALILSVFFTKLTIVMYAFRNLFFSGLLSIFEVFCMYKWLSFGQGTPKDVILDRFQTDVVHVKSTDEILSSAVSKLCAHTDVLSVVHRSNNKVALLDGNTVVTDDQYPVLFTLNQLSVLCNNAETLGDTVIGSPVDIALLLYAEKMKIPDYRVEMTRYSEITTSNLLHLVCNVGREDFKVMHCVRGDPVTVLDRCATSFGSEFDKKSIMNTIAKVKAQHPKHQILAFGNGLDPHKLVWIGLIVVDV